MNETKKDLRQGEEKVQTKNLEFDDSIIPQFDEKSARIFLETLYKDIPEGYITLNYSNPKIKKNFGGFHFKKIRLEQLLEFSKQRYAENHLWFSPNILKTPPADTKNNKAENTEISYITSVYLDIDVLEGDHKKSKLPNPSYEQAYNFLNNLKHKPTFIIDSGGGYHAYWVLDKPLKVNITKENKDSVITKRFNNVFSKYFKNNRELNLDNVGDASRILRLPGSFNHKEGSKKQVTIKTQTDIRYTIEEIEAFISEIEKATKPDTLEQISKRKINEPLVPLDPIVQGCNFIKHTKDDAAALPEPEWYHMLTIVSRTENGAKTAHEWSKPYRGYSERETDAKINQALNNSGPMTCEELMRHGYCDGCDLIGKITSPINIGQVALQEQEKKEAIKLVSKAIDKMKEDKAAVLEPNVLDKLLFLESKHYESYVRLEEDVLKAGLKKTQLTTALKKQKAKNAQRFQEQNKNDDPLSKWKVEDNQLKKLKLNPWGANWETVTRTIPEIKKVLTSVEDKGEFWLLSFKTVRGQTVEKIVSRSDMANPRVVSDTLSAYGFDVNQSNAKDISDYLRDYDAAHAEQIKQENYIDRFGWTDDFKSFVIGNDVIGDQNITYQAPGEGEQQIANALTAKGSLEDWNMVIKLLEGRPWALFKVFQAFLPPLLPFFELNGHTFANHGESSLGKTLSDSIAGSVWGNVNYKARKDSIIQQGVGVTLDKAEKIVATMTHIPVFLQDAHEAVPGVIPRIIHAIEIGQGKGRGHNSNGSQAFRKVNTILNLTSESPLESESKNGGIFARVIEFNGSVFGNHDLLFKKSIMSIIFDNYGVPGRAFIEYLINHIESKDDWKKMFRDHETELLKDLKENNEELDDKVARKIDYFIAVLVAATIAAEALQLPITRYEIINTVRTCFREQILTADSSPYYEKGMNVLRDYITSNQPRFWSVGSENNNADSRYGAIPGVWNKTRGFVAMTQKDVTQVLKEADYDLKRCLKEWVKVGYVKTDKKGKPQMVTHIPYNDSKTRMLRFPIDVIQTDEEEEE